MLRALLSRTLSPRVRRTIRTRRVGCELLEGRRLLATFMVNNLGDDWVGGTLRVSLTQAAQTPGNNTVVFDPTVFNVPRTITLTRDYPLMLGSAAGSVTVIGPGSNMLTVQGNNTSTVFGNATWDQPASLSGMTITGGHSSGYGGGLDASGSGLSLTDVVFRGNSTGGYGGGASIFSTSGTTTLTNVAFIGNSASHEGGGLFIGGNSATLTNVTFTNNSGLYGGGMYTVSGSRTLTNVTFTNNSASGYGGGMSAADGQDSLESVTFNGNTAPTGGGLFTANGARTLTNVTFGNNAATTSGGGIAASNGSETLKNVTFAGNSAPVGGGLIGGLGSRTLSNVTFAGNSAQIRGGGLELTGGTNTLTNLTISQNTAPLGSGLMLAPQGSAVLTNTILAGNTGSSNLAYYVSNPYTGSNNLIGGDPKLSPLGWYGGPTQTMPPLAGSAAIGAGTTSGAPTTDQRGFPRGSSIDLGAFQTQGTMNLVVSGTGETAAAPGGYTLRSAVNLANQHAGPDTITFDPGVFGTPKSITLTGGELELADSATTTITGPGANLLTISGNNASRVFNVSGSASISGLAVTGGQAPGGGTSSGGGIFNASGANLSLTNVLVSGNHATAGGGIANRGTATLNNVTISGNSALVGGGMMSFGTANLTNATVSGNTASTFGGGLYDYMGKMSLKSVTVSGNSAGISNGGGGLMNYLGNTSLTSTIVAGNNGGDVSGNSITGAFNLIGGNPRLAPLGYYGGQTPTMALLPGSPALRAGSGALYDQRGFFRGSVADIGAFQSRGFNVAITGGNNQSTKINTQFATPLSVNVTSPYGEPVAGGAVIFSTPGPGTMATFTVNPAPIDAQGNASVIATATGMIGGYDTWASTNAGMATFRLTNNLQAAAQGRPVSSGTFDAVIAALGAESEPDAPASPSGPTSSSTASTSRLKVVTGAAYPKLEARIGRARLSFLSSKGVTSKFASPLLD
ncbi:choice-of-anchor Q domain-containing protein [Aquisphaera insulae]|uniref:choice-of-anchor Q domain-containing protein n=1 Tax=Aquisphaera insulae TaxID=2712864 RepID=UPI0013EB9D3F|nr:choice-of-anchor Q domain-containing protein [Aquisphaera insulae]